MSDDKPIILGPGRLYFDDKLIGKINPSTGGRIQPTQTEVIPAILPHGETVTGRWPSRNLDMMTLPRRTPGYSAAIAKEQLATYRLSLPMPDYRPLERVIAVGVYGKKIGRLLTSHDPRQRKRGKRLAELHMTKKVRAAIAKHRERAEKRLAAMWYAELGEPYDPERYRKD